MTRYALLALVAGASILLWAVPATAHQDVHEEIEELTSRIAADPVNAELYLRRGEMHRIHQDWTAALADYERSRQLDPELHEVDLGLGRMRLEAGQPREAIAALDRFLAARPGEALALVFRGRARMQIGNPRAAASDYTLAIDRMLEDGQRPTPEMYVERSEALEAAGTEYRDEALRGLEQGSELLRRPVTLELEALELELALGRTGAALARLDRLAASAATPAPWHLRRGEVLEREGRLEEARAAYEQALDGLAALPAQRRGAGPMARLQAQVREALARLGARPHD
jgi:tetratricopeptide (TPR) repeat protein